MEVTITRLKKQLLKHSKYKYHIPIYITYQNLFKAVPTTRPLQVFFMFLEMLKYDFFENLVPEPAQIWLQI
jgi:hypothetical protein